MKNICVLVSGGGTNLQSVIDAIESGEIRDARIAGVISSKKDVYALERAKKHGIPSKIIIRKAYESKEEFDQAILEALKTFGADLIVLANGGKPDDSLFTTCQKEQVAPLLYNIGDSFAAGRVLEATRAAYALATKL